MPDHRHPSNLRQSPLAAEGTGLQAGIGRVIVEELLTLRVPVQFAALFHRNQGELT
jgi:hypothetical protein